MNNGFEIVYDTVSGMTGRNPKEDAKTFIRPGIKNGQAYAWSRTRNEERIHEYHKK